MPKDKILDAMRKQRTLTGNDASPNLVVPRVRSTAPTNRQVRPTQAVATVQVAYQ
jgi:hypothetical protein